MRPSACFSPGVKRADGDVVEQAEAHGPARLGMMARRPHRAEGVVYLAGHDRIDGVADRAGGAQRGFGRTRAHHRVAIDPAAIIVLHRREHMVDQGRGMHQMQNRRVDPWCLPPLQPGDVRFLQAIEHGGDPRRALRMMAAGPMVQTGRMGVYGCGHASSIQSEPACAGSPAPQACRARDCLPQELSCGLIVFPDHIMTERGVAKALWPSTSAPRAENGTQP